jgi:hypothetical protein
MNLVNLYVEDIFDDYFVVSWFDYIKEMQVSVQNFKIVDNEYVAFDSRIHPVDHLPPEIYEVVNDRNILRNSLIDALNFSLEDAQEDLQDDTKRYEREIASWKETLQDDNDRINRIQKILDSV